MAPWWLILVNGLTILYCVDLIAVDVGRVSCTWSASGRTSSDAITYGCAISFLIHVRQQRHHTGLSRVFFCFEIFNAMSSFFCSPPSSDSFLTWVCHLFFSPVFRDQPALVRYFLSYFSARTMKHVTELLWPHSWVVSYCARCPYLLPAQCPGCRVLPFLSCFFPTFNNDLPIIFVKGLNILKLKPLPLRLTPQNMGMELPFCIWRYKWGSVCHNFIFFFKKSYPVLLWHSSFFLKNATPLSLLQDS